MKVARPSREDQSALWNGTAGNAWVEAQATLDTMLQPFEDLLVAGVPVGGSRVLDVGCGTGSTTLAVARRLGSEGHVVGIDISEPMIAAAQTRAEREASKASFICADAQDYAFDPARFDAIISRFGVMFFADSVRAFANLRGAARAGAVLQCIAWRSPAENPFMTTAERAAAPFLPSLPPRNLDAPGQFAFANRDRIERILEESGWSEIGIEPIDVGCTLPASELFGYFTRLGPLSLILRETDEPTRTQVVEAVGDAFGEYVHGEEVRFTGACWMIRARETSAVSERVVR